MTDLQALQEKLQRYKDLLEEFNELESASHGMTSKRIQNELDKMADKLRLMETELNVPEEYRNF